jgi:hypothetical protein
MFDFVDLNHSGISFCTSIGSSVIVNCAQYNFSKKFYQTELEPDICFKTVKSYLFHPLLKNLRRITSFKKYIYKDVRQLCYVILLWV